VIHAIEVNFLVLITGQAEHLEREQFKSAQQFCAALQQQRRVGTGELHQDLRPFPIAFFGQGRVDGDPVFQAQTTLADYATQQFIDLVGGLDFVGNCHKSSSWLLAFDPLFLPAIELTRQSPTRCKPTAKG